MGCVTSKVMTRTGSYREELNRSLKKRYGDFHDLLISTSGRREGDQYLVASDVDEKEGSKAELSSNKVVDHETINMWDLMSGLEAGQVDRQQEQTNHALKRSQSLRPSSLDHEIVKCDQYGVHEGERNDVRVRSRSFHTVDEYDAILMERNGRQEREWEDKLEDFLANAYATRVQHASKACSDDKNEGLQEIEANSQHTSNVAPVAYKSEFIFDMGTDDVKTGHGDVKGVQRIRRAKDLTSLAIPSTIEFPVATNLNNTSEAYQGQLVSYGDYDYYATPKFGSFDIPVQSNNYRFSLEVTEEEKCVFDPELVSSFQVAMEQLQVEEEFLLNQINNKNTN